jgi:hypothetical protein
MTEMADKPGRSSIGGLKKLNQKTQQTVDCCGGVLVGNIARAKAVTEVRIGA